jgi:hypothetical protein
MRLVSYQRLRSSSQFNISGMEMWLDSAADALRSPLQTAAVMIHAYTPPRRCQKEGGPC